jgi:hypothetical protein
MTFTHLGRAVAALAFFLGLLLIVINLSFMFGWIDPELYVATKTPGQMLNRGVLILFFSVVLGVLVDISHSIAKSSQSIAEGTPIKPDRR